MVTENRPLKAAFLNHQIEQYYDKNTSLFLTFGGSKQSFAIHRGLWGPGVTNSEQAANYLNQIIAKDLTELKLKEDFQVIDFGCGVGGTLFQLAKHFPRVNLNGVTISQKQIDIANKIAEKKNLTQQCRFYKADFHTINLAFKADIIIAIESLIHSDSKQKFLEQVSSHLNDFGYLVVVDDFLVLDHHNLTPNAKHIIETFKKGWRVPGLCSLSNFLTSCHQIGLQEVKVSNLTHLIKLGRPRDQLISLLCPLFEKLELTELPFFSNMIGGNALQISLKNKYVQYQYLILQKRP